MKPELEAAFKKVETLMDEARRADGVQETTYCGHSAIAFVLSLILLELSAIKEHLGTRK